MEKKEIEMVAIINLLELLPLLSVTGGQRCRGRCWFGMKKKILHRKGRKACGGYSCCWQGNGIVRVLGHQ